MKKMKNKKKHEKKYYSCQKLPMMDHLIEKKEVIFKKQKKTPNRVFF